MAIYSTSTITATLVASTAYSALEIKTPSSTGIRILKWWVEFNSVTSTDKFVLVQVGRFSAAVTTNTGVTPARADWGYNALVSQCTVGVNATSEGAGTFNASYEQHQVPPNSGLTMWEPREMAWQTVASDFFRIRLTPGSALTSTTAAVGCTWEE
jgi:hypothetical protein